ncbi:MAG: J domain-containing protein [Bacteroidales bacterium]|nr:J domain-containing protein [Bacteroidales bacterium]
MEKYYHILNLPPNASWEEVKSSFRKLVMQYHPDKNPSPEAKEIFIQILDAYEHIKLYHERKNFKVTTSQTEVFDAEAYIKERIRQYIRMRYEEILREEMALSSLPIQKLFLPRWLSSFFILFAVILLLDYWVLPLRSYNCELEVLNYGFRACNSIIYLTPEDAEKAGQCIHLYKTHIFKLVKKIRFEDGTQSKITNSYDEYIILPILLIVLNIVAIWIPLKNLEGKIVLMIFIVVLFLSILLSLIFLQ